MPRRASKSGPGMAQKQLAKEKPSEEGELSDADTVAADDDRDSDTDGILTKLANECGTKDKPAQSVSNTDARSDDEDIQSGQRMRESQTQNSQVKDSQLPSGSGTSEPKRSISASLKQFTEGLDMSGVKAQLGDAHTGRSASVDPADPPRRGLPSFNEYMDAMRNPQQPPQHLRQSWLGPPSSHPVSPMGYMGWQAPWGPYGPLPWGILRPPMPPEIEARLNQIYPLP